MMEQNVPEPVGPRRNYSISVADLPERNEARVQSTRFLKVAEEYGITPGNKHIVPEKVLTGTREMQAGFIRGLFSADGHVNQPTGMGAGIHLTSISRELLIDMQRLLLNFRIASRIYFDRRPAGTKELPNGKGGTQEYNVKAYHELVISKDNLLIFQDEIGFLDDYKTTLLEESAGFIPGIPQVGKVHRQVQGTCAQRESRKYSISPNQLRIRSLPTAWWYRIAVNKYFCPTSPATWAR